MTTPNTPVSTKPADLDNIMKQWDYWRAQIASGDKSSGPRDWFESVLESLATPAPSVPLGGGEVVAWEVTFAAAGDDCSTSKIVTKYPACPDDYESIKALGYVAQPLQAQDAAPVGPTDEDLWELRRQAKADPRCAEQHWFILFARAAIAASKPVPWMTGGEGAAGVQGDAARLTPDEIEVILQALGEHDGSDFEPECPNCTAYRKLAAIAPSTKGD